MAHVASKGAWWTDIKTAFAFLTRLPVRLPGSPPPLAEAAWAFPLVGLPVGLTGGLVLLLFAWIGLHPLACALLALAAQAWLTGALHEDGLADVADGFGGGADRTAKLHIMRDSRIGTFGVLALVFSVGLRAAALAGYLGLGVAVFALVAAGAASRGVLPMVMFVLPAVRDGGLSKNAGTPKAGDAVAALIIGWALGVAVLVPVLGFEAAAGIWFSSMAAAAFVAWLAKRRIGGQTGDVLGACQQAAEITMLLAVGVVA